MNRIRSALGARTSACPRGSSRTLKVVDRDLLDRGVVEDLGLHDDDGIWVADCGE